MEIKPVKQGEVVMTKQGRTLLAKDIGVQRKGSGLMRLGSACAKDIGVQRKGSWLDEIRLCLVSGSS